MEITTTIKFYINYVPLHNRKTQFKEVTTSVTNKIKEVPFDALTNLYKNNFHNTRGYYYKGSVYEKVKFDKWGDTRVEDIDNGNDVLSKMKWWHLYGSKYFANTLTNFHSGKETFETFEDVLARLQKDLSQFIIVDGILYEKIYGLPCYQIMTFGLGNNHGGTGLLVTYYKHPKQAVKEKENKGRVFLATDWENALKAATEIALNRGDTESIKHFRKNISVRENFYERKFG